MLKPWQGYIMPVTKILENIDSDIQRALYFNQIRKLDEITSYILKYEPKETRQQLLDACIIIQEGLTSL